MRKEMIGIAEWYEKLVFPLPWQLLTDDQSFRIVYMPDSVEQHHLCSLICSLPLLEDLCVGRSSAGNVGGSHGIRETVLHPSTPPMLTGTLKIDRFQGIEHFIPRLLDLSKGIRFRRLECWWDSKEDIQRTMTCIDACSDTLEYVDVCSLIRGMFISVSVV